MSLDAYLFFPGNCEQAVRFYERALGAEVESLMRMSDSPEPPPPECAGMPGDAVMHASLRVGDRRLMASDTPPGDGAAFKGFSLSLTAPDQAAAHRLFNALAEGGQVQMPLGKTFWTSCFGMLTDRFGVGWMISVEEG